MTQSLRSLALVLSTSIRVGPVLSLLCFLETIGRVLTALNPLWFGMFTAGAVKHQSSLMIWAIAGLTGSVGLATVLIYVGAGASVRLNTHVAFAFDIQVAELTGSIETLDHLENPELLDKLQILRDNDGALAQALNGLVVSINNLAWAATSVTIAITADWRLILLAVFGLPRLAAVRWTLRWDRQAEEQSGPPSRLAQSLLTLTATPSAAAETRVFGLQEEMRRQISTAVRAWRAPLTAKAQRYGLLDAAAGAFYFGASTAVIGWIAYDALHGTVSPRVLVVAVAVIGSMQQVSQTLIYGVQMFSAAIRNANRFLWLKEYAESTAAAHRGTQAPPSRLLAGIRLEHLTFRYPGAEANSLDDVTLDLTAGSVIALVGENGAGKSTLAKLLCGLYRPTNGHILIDGTDLAELNLTSWRSRISGAFQDHANYELTVRESVGVGELAQIDNADAVMRALRDGAADDVIDALPHGLDTQLGTSWPDGVDISGGQWQRLAIGRGMMRTTPLVLILDEPTSALDATTEHALFEQYVAKAHSAGRRGAVTLLVTHRFSTVAAADLVVVLDRGRVTEIGTHGELIALGGRYAELYELQARGYR